MRRRCDGQADRFVLPFDPDPDRDLLRQATAYVGQEERARVLGELVDCREQPPKDLANGALGKRFFHPPDGVRPMLSIDNEKPVDTDRSDACQDVRGVLKRLAWLGAINGRMDECRNAERWSARLEVVRPPDDVEELPELALRWNCDIAIEPGCESAFE